MKTRTIIILAVVVLAVMIVEWKFATSMGAASAIHGYHGTCNGGVGQPYADFMRELRTLAESGDTNRLATVLRRADERSRDIYAFGSVTSGTHIERAFMKFSGCPNERNWIQPFQGWDIFHIRTQGSSFRATLGWMIYILSG